MMELTHAVQKAAVSKLVDHIISIKDEEERRKSLIRLSYMIQKVYGNMFESSTFDSVRELLMHNHKWWKYLNRALDTLNPHIIKTAVMDLGFEAAFYGNKKRWENREKYGINIPWVILFDPTSACNCHCIGCWAAEYGHTLNLSYDVMNKIVTQGKALGIHFYMMTGGEPLVRKVDILKLCKAHPDCEFHAFTNGTLIDDDFCRKVCEVGNLSFSISIEGWREVNDSRRGKGHFDKVMHAMDLLHKYGIVYGTSICYTRKNIETVTSDDFIDMLISKGAWYTWYFHYMPVGKGASLDLLPTREQRAYMVHRVREIRELETGKPFMALDFQNDGQYIGGCIAGGRNYCHINPNGDVEPCVFIHYSSANINKDDLLTCLSQPLFKEYAKGQPFNKNHLRPCPMLENPPKLAAMVKRCGAKSTDLLAPESADELCDKCMPYARQWAPMADKLWKSIKNRKVMEDHKAPEEMKRNISKGA